MKSSLYDSLCRFADRVNEISGKPVLLQAAAVPGLIGLLIDLLRRIIFDLETLKREREKS